MLITIVATTLQLHFIQCPFPNQTQFGLEKLQPKIAYNFPNQFQFGLERKIGILQDADSKLKSDWFGDFDDHCQRPENSKPKFSLEKSLTDANALNLEPIPV